MSASRDGSTPDDDAHLSLGALASSVVDVAYETLFDTQRTLALLPSSYETGPAASDDVERSNLESAATTRRSGLLEWTNRTIALFTQLHAITFTHASPAHADDAPIAVSLQRCKRLLADAQLLGSGVAETCVAIDAVAAIMRAGARPRFDIAAAVGVRMEGAPFALLPADAYTAPPPLYGVVDRHARVHSRTADVIAGHALDTAARSCSDVQLHAMVAACQWPPHLRKNVHVHPAAASEAEHATVHCPDTAGVHIFIVNGAVHICIQHRLVLQLHALADITHEAPEPWRVASLVLASRSRVVRHAPEPHISDAYSAACAGTPSPAQLAQLASALQTQLHASARSRSRSALAGCVATCVAVLNAYTLAHALAHARAHITAPDTVQQIPLPTVAALPGATCVTRLELTHCNPCAGGRVRVCSDGTTLLLSSMHVKRMAVPPHTRVCVQPFRVTQIGVDAAGRPCARAQVFITERAHAFARGMYEPFNDAGDTTLDSGVPAPTPHSVTLLPDDGGDATTLPIDEVHLWQGLYAPPRPAVVATAPASVARSVYERSAGTGLYERSQTTSSIPPALQALIDAVSDFHLSASRPGDSMPVSALLRLKSTSARVHSITCTGKNTFEWSASAAPRALGPSGNEVEYKLCEATAPPPHACVTEAAPPLMDAPALTAPMTAPPVAFTVSDVTGFPFIHALTSVCPRVSALAYSRVATDAATSMLLLLQAGSALYVSRCSDAPATMTSRVHALHAFRNRALKSLTSDRTVLLAHVLSAAACGRAACVAGAAHTAGVLLGRGEGAAGEIGGLCVTIVEDPGERYHAQRAYASSTHALLSASLVSSDMPFQQRARNIVMEDMAQAEIELDGVPAGVSMACLPISASGQQWTSLPGRDVTTNVPAMLDHSARSCAQVCMSLAVAILAARAPLRELLGSLAGDARTMCSVTPGTGDMVLQFSPTAIVRISIDSSNAIVSATIEDVWLQSAREPAAMGLHTRLQDECSAATERMRVRVRAVVNACARRIADASDDHARATASTFTHAVRALVPTWFPVPRSSRDDAVSVVSSAVRSDAGNADDEDAQAHVAAMLQPFLLDACSHLGNVAVHCPGTLVPPDASPQHTYRSRELLAACIADLDTNGLKHDTTHMQGRTYAQFDAHVNETGATSARDSSASAPHVIASICAVLADTHACDALALLASPPVDTVKRMQHMLNVRASLMRSASQPARLLTTLAVALGFNGQSMPDQDATSSVRAFLKALTDLVLLPSAQSLYDASTNPLREFQQPARVPAPCPGAALSGWSSVAMVSLKCACAVAAALAHEAARLISRLHTITQVHALMKARAAALDFVGSQRPAMRAHMFAPFTRFLGVTSCVLHGAAGRMPAAGMKRQLEELHVATASVSVSTASAAHNRPLYSGHGMLYYASRIDDGPVQLRSTPFPATSVRVTVCDDAYATLKRRLHVNRMTHVCASIELPSAPRLSITDGTGSREHAGADIQWIVAPSDTPWSTLAGVRLRWMSRDSVTALCASLGCDELSIAGLPAHHAVRTPSDQAAACVVIELPFDWIAPVTCHTAAAWLERELMSASDAQGPLKRARVTEPVNRTSDRVCDAKMDRICAAIRAQRVAALVAAAALDGAACCVVLHPSPESISWMPVLDTGSHSAECVASESAVTAPHVLSLPWLRADDLAVPVMFAHAGVGAAVRAALGAQVHSTAAARLRMRAQASDASSAGANATVQAQSTASMRPTEVVLAAVHCELDAAGAIVKIDQDARVANVTECMLQAAGRMATACSI